MGTYTIGQVAERSGFSPSALRYYEGIGLVTPASRTGSGYRVYDDHTLARLGFINRAKQLGCSLEEITDLVGLWDGDRCGPVQRRFHDLVTAKMVDAQVQVRELTALASQLRAVAGQLAGPATDGACDDGCACMTGTRPVSTGSAVSVGLGAKPDVPIACTLDGDAMGDRVAEWQAILAQATSRTRTVDGALRADFGGGVDLGELARLVAAEQGCCAFFAFAITVDHRGIGLEVSAPDGAEPMVAALFGEAA
jgi:DNA-binding transcriptional MerR regulator